MSDRRGFTLIELAVVISLIAAFFLVALPTFKDITQVNIKSASRRLTGNIKYLYNEAAFKKRIFRLVFDGESGEYWAEVLASNEGENEFVALDDSDPLLRRGKLPDGVYFRDVVTERSFQEIRGRREENSDEAFILFYSNGVVEPAVIYLETENGAVYTIATKPYTGGTIVLDEYVDPETLYAGGKGAQ